MKIRTAGQFTDAISANLAHRKRDLTALNGLIGRCRGHELKVVTNSAVCILYAHWEGFVKFGGTCFANYVFHQGISAEHLSNGVIASALRDRLREVRSTKKVSLCRDFVESMRHPNSRMPPFNWKQAVETYDNLKLEVLIEVLALVGCETSFYEGKKGIIDEKLVGYRNSISHTGYSDLEPQDYPDLHQATIVLLNRFRDDLEDAVSKETFRA